MMADCRRLADEVAAALAGGTVPKELLGRLDESIRLLTRSGKEIPSAAVTALLESLATARQAGAAWLQRVAGPELEALARERRGLDAYRRRSRLT
jgi:hypothetical protein